MGHPEQAAEGCTLALWHYQQSIKQNKIPTLELFDESDTHSFKKGLFKAEIQNLARRLSETPANQMTPTRFADEAARELCYPGVKMRIYDTIRIRSRGLNAFLRVRITDNRRL